MKNNADIAAMLADGALSGEEKREAENLVSANPQAKSEYQAIMTLKRVLREKLPAPDTSKAWPIVKGRIQELQKTTRAEYVVGRYGYAMAAVLMMAIMSAAYMSRIGGSVMDKNNFQRTLSAGLGETRSAAPNLTEGEKLIYDVLKSPMLELKRVDIIRVDGETIRRIIYNDGEANYLLLEAPGVHECAGEDIPNAPGMKYTQVNGVNVISWCEGNTGYAFASRKPVSTLLSLLR